MKKHFNKLVVSCQLSPVTKSKILYSSFRRKPESSQKYESLDSGFRRNDTLLCKGFTLLELMVVIGIIAVAMLFTVPSISNWNKQSSFNNAVIFFKSVLATAKDESFARNTTTKIVFTKTGDEYNFKTYYSSTPITSCTAITTWTLISNEDFSMNTSFQASGLNDICFFRDGSTTGASINIAQKNNLTEYDAKNISVLIATGFIDVQ